MCSQSDACVHWWDSFFSVSLQWIRLDVLLMVLATLSSICHGAAVPLQFIIFGGLMNSFVNFAKFQTANVTQPFDLEGDMTKFALYYVYMACGTLIVAYGQMGLWSVTATRQVRQMRLAFFRSILKTETLVGLTQLIQESSTIDSLSKYYGYLLSFDWGSYPGMDSQSTSQKKQYIIPDG